jgi:site-specific recombinase
LNGNHEPIIDPDPFDQVQYELASRYANRAAGKHHLFSGRIKCCE